MILLNKGNKLKTKENLFLYELGIYEMLLVVNRVTINKYILSLKKKALYVRGNIRT